MKCFISLYLLFVVIAFVACSSSSNESEVKKEKNIEIEENGFLNTLIEKHCTAEQKQRESLIAIVSRACKQCVNPVYVQKVLDDKLENQNVVLINEGLMPADYPNHPDLIRLKSGELERAHIKLQGVSIIYLSNNKVESIEPVPFNKRTY